MGKPTDASSDRSEVLSTGELNSSGIERIVISLESGEEEALVAKQGGDFKAYELYESSNYTGNLSRRILKG